MCMNVCAASCQRLGRSTMWACSSCRWSTARRTDSPSPCQFACYPLCMGPTGGPRLDIPHLAVTCNSVYVCMYVCTGRRWPRCRWRHRRVSGSGGCKTFYSLIKKWRHPGSKKRGPFPCRRSPCSICSPCSVWHAQWAITSSTVWHAAVHTYIHT